MKATDRAETKASRKAARRLGWHIHRLDCTSGRERMVAARSFLQSAASRVDSHVAEAACAPVIDGLLELTGFTEPRRVEFHRARAHAAHSVTARLSFATDSVRTALAEMSPEDARRVARRASDLMAAAAQRLATAEIARLLGGPQ